MIIKVPEGDDEIDLRDYTDKVKEFLHFEINEAFEDIRALLLGVLDELKDASAPIGSAPHNAWQLYFMLREDKYWIDLL